MSASVDLSSFLNGLGAAKAAAIAEAERAVDVFSEHVVGDAQEMAPVDTGDLKGSGTRGRTAREVAADVPIERKGDVIEKVIGFNTNYAAAVHERLDLHHDQGQAKFLEAALRQNQLKFMPFVSKRVMGRIGG